MLTRRRTKKTMRQKSIGRRALSNHRVELRTLKARENEFRGRNVIVIGKEIHAIENGEQAARLMEELLKKYPKRAPLLAYVMEDEMYIL
jgi:ribosomal protein L10